jgi:DNA-binding NarL/FixJ family response regulator
MLQSDTPIRVVSVEDHWLVSEWLQARLHHAGMKLVARLPSADQLVETCRDNPVDIVIVDITIPGSDPFVAVDALLRDMPGVNVLFLTASTSEHHLTAALNSGALGYFSKLDETASIVDGVRAVSAGRYAFGETILKRFPELNESVGKTRQQTDMRRDSVTGDSGGNVEPGFAELTPREQEVLRLLGQGFQRSQIAKTLNRSPKTIDKHRAAIMRKLDINDRAKLVLYAVREGIVSP